MVKKVGWRSGYDAKVLSRSSRWQERLASEGGEGGKGKRKSRVRRKEKELERFGIERKRWKDGNGART